MEINEIKKTLYKEKPNAFLRLIARDGGSRIYSAEISEGTIIFNIPYKEVDDSFKSEMEAQLLIRWIDLEATTKANYKNGKDRSL